VHSVENTTVEIWQSPPELRSQMRSDVMTKVLAEMMTYDCQWSLTTAARAVFMSAQLSSIDDDEDLLDEIETCWESPLICTSVVIEFWQRYVCEVAAKSAQCKATMIMKYMPLRADASLPGDLIAALRRCLWVRVHCLK